MRVGANWQGDLLVIVRVVVRWTGATRRRAGGLNLLCKELVQWTKLELVLFRAWGREEGVGYWAADKLCRDELTVGCCLDRSMAIGASVHGEEKKSRLTCCGKKETTVGER